MSKENIRVSVIEDINQDAWDDFVLNHPESAPYHLYAWKKAIEAAYGHRCTYLTAMRSNTIEGVLPIVHLRLPLFVNELISLPFCDVGNCLTITDEAQDQLIKEIFNLKLLRKAKKLQLRGNIAITDFVQTNLRQIENDKVRMVLDLPGSSVELFNSFKSKLRSQVRKAEKNGIKFSWGGISDLDNAFEVFSRNMLDLGSPVHSKSYLEKILLHYDKRAKLGLAEYQGKLVGMGLILICKNKASIPWASTLNEYNHLSPNMLIYWNCLKYCADNGCECFDFGRSSEGEGTFKFKKQWGANPVKLHWYESIDPSTDVPTMANTYSTKRERAADLWRRMPLSVANKIGPVLRKYINL